MPSDFRNSVLDLELQLVGLEGPFVLGGDVVEEGLAGAEEGLHRRAPVAVAKAAGELAFVDPFPKS